MASKHASDAPQNRCPDHDEDGAAMLLGRGVGGCHAVACALRSDRADEELQRLSVFRLVVMRDFGNGKTPRGGHQHHRDASVERCDPTRVFNQAAAQPKAHA